MKRTWMLVGLCGVALVAGALGFADPKANPKDAKGAMDHKDPAGAGGAPDMAAMMEAWKTSMTPGEMHKHLTEKAGVWEGKVKMWMDPSMPPTESNCTTTISVMMDGRFTRSETKGNMDMGTGEPMPFEGFGLYGYNNTTKKFESTWVDNLGTMMMSLTGELSADKKVLTWNGKFTDPMSGQPSWMREVETTNGADSMTLEMYGPGMDGKDMKMMEIQYARKK